EIEQWVAKYTSDVNGRPLKDNSTNDKDKEKFGKLSDAEKKQLADVVSGATFSLNDAHGNIVAAIKNAYENKLEVTIPLK
ncbi:MAG: FMN-binding protein, partial [Clostridiales bacterium]|nr:FMN-binding protein [Clostridiales bacterium]